MIPSCCEIDIGESTEGRDCFTPKAKSIEGAEIVVTGELGGVVLQSCNFLSTTSQVVSASVRTYSLVILLGDAGSVILNFDSVEAMVLKTDVCRANNGEVQYDEGCFG